MNGERNPPLWLMISGAPTKIFYTAFYSDQIGIWVFTTLALQAGFQAYQTYGTRKFWLAFVLAFVGVSCLIQILHRPFAGLPRPKGRPRAPAHLLLSRLLGMHKTASIVGDALLLIPFVFATGSVLSRGPIGYLWWALLCAFYMPFSRFFALNIGVIQLLKLVAGRRFNIVVFRKFFDGGPPGEFDHRHRTMVLPSLGSYGNVFLVHNESIEAARPGVNADSEEILSQLRGAVKCDGDSWRDQVLQFIRSADLAVFHWETYPTEHMLWELERVADVLPTSRMLFLESKPGWGLPILLQARFRTRLPTVVHLDDSLRGLGKLQNELYRFMRNLRSAEATEPADTKPFPAALQE